ncbi:OPT family oligopeptide transporter [Arcanobacterium hippocoleae]|uniref:OPT family oligopeptide transporter n=1 Tax=Arcanobacterium hippocoleae TaxID=149017 RepID=A0ABU1T332_9ACTO|nr:oligopeptide transporter, OPT family [Arcanobacterium hippocoleae]MDR6939792.1 putative OPT family oligopeptide transporter [Arcanobacterium hippocoleae]
MSSHASMQASKEKSPIKELTIRGVILGGLITLVFTAANVYLGLKVGLTFATSIPAAVISMAILRKFADHTVIENNIVQTIASAAGTLSAIIFVLPGLIMIGYWTGFNYWETALVCAIGGILGVTYSIPLRRALVTGSDLPYPEGVAAAEVLKVGDTHGSAEENKRGLKVIIGGSLVSAGYQLLVSLKVAAGSIAKYFHVGAGGTMVASSLSLALIGVGHLVGVAVGIAMIVGVLISFGVLLPVFTQNVAGLSADVVADLPSLVDTVFANNVRFVGAGAMAVAAVWTLLKIILPIIKGIKESIASSQKRNAGEEVDLTERDIPFSVVAGVTLASMIPVGILLWLFVKDTPISHHTGALIALSIIFVLLIGLIVASICGYMAGLIGASNSPISGVGVIVVLAAALLIKVVTGSEADSNADALIAYTLFTASVVFGIATISNDNLQDLKTGQLVGATPWKQQVALIIGVVFGSLIIPPVLQLMHAAFGFAGAPGAGENALAAPQAQLLSSIAKGVLSGDLRWDLVGIGAIIGIVICVVNEVLIMNTRNSARKLSLPPLAVGMGMYLPMSLTVLISVGAFIGLAYDKWAARKRNAEAKKRLGVLLATGLIVGESLYGVLNAGIIAGSGSESPLAIMPDGFAGWDQLTGVVVFIAMIVLSYKWVQHLAQGIKADAK